MKFDANGIAEVKAEAESTGQKVGRHFLDSLNNDGLARRSFTISQRLERDENKQKEIIKMMKENSSLKKS